MKNTSSKLGDLIKFKDSYFVSCPIGLEALLEKEVEAIGFKNFYVASGGVHFDGYSEKVLELLLTSRIASRVFKKLYQFPIEKEKDVYFGARDIKWKAIFGLEQTFKIISTLGRSPNQKVYSHFKNTMVISQILKDGMVDRFRDDCGARPNVNTENPDVVINCHIYPENEGPFHIATIMIDLCGKSLSHRGYRPPRGEAPIRENLAAGLVMLSDWKSQAEDFMDIFCGSGTLLIEAALIAGNIPPSYLKLAALRANQNPVYSFQRLDWFTKDKYLVENFHQLIDKLDAQTKKGFELLSTMTKRFWGSDNSFSAISMAKEQIDRARLSRIINLQTMDATAVTPNPDRKGIIVTNPPYGVRMEETIDLESLYYDVGENFKHHFKGWRAYLISGNRDLFKRISLKTSKKWILFNGALECRFVKYDMY
jgi:23S rRNA G2445 N2-methylase RlmL